jgi:hypothetical protein
MLLAASQTLHFVNIVSHSLALVSEVGGNIVVGIDINPRYLYPETLYPERPERTLPFYLK